MEGGCVGDVSAGDEGRLQDILQSNQLLLLAQSGSRLEFLDRERNPWCRVTKGEQKFLKTNLFCENNFVGTGCDWMRQGSESQTMRRA